MNMETIREWLNRQPFEPFVLRMSNGEVHEVRHPECMAIGKTRMAVSYPEQDRMVHLSLIHVNAIEAVQAAKWRFAIYDLKGIQSAVVSPAVRCADASRNWSAQRGHSSF